MNPVNKALWYIESHFAEAPDLDEIASVAGVSRYHLTRAFGDVTGQSIMRYMRGRRLTLAARALSNGAPDILAVALDAGYGSHEAFTRAFRERDVSTSPLWHKSNALKFMRGNADYDGKLIVDGTWDFAIVDGLEPRADEPVMMKQRYSCFAGTSFEQYLHARDIRSLIVIGVNTNVCVESTVREGFMNDYYIVLVRDGTAAYSNEEHEMTVRNIDRFFGEISTIEELRGIWSGRNA